MLVLTPENTSFDMNEVGEYAPNKMFCALDLSDISNSDYYFFNILNTVSFSSIAVELKIGNYSLQVPMNWQILIGDEDTGMLEVVHVEDLLAIKSPYAFVYNPIKSRYPQFLPVSVSSICTVSLKWQIPLIRKSHMLAVPLESKEIPLCAFFADETDKFPEFMLGA